MSSILARKPRSATGDVNGWERSIYGTTYWFDATPYEVKAFRLTADSGELVRHWIDTPDTIGEYDPNDPSTRPSRGRSPGHGTGTPAGPTGSTSPAAAPATTSWR